MNNRQMPDSYAEMARERARAEASSAWAGAIKLALLLGALAAFVWLLNYAFGIAGLQFGLIAAFIMLVAIGVAELMKSMKQQTIDTMETTVNAIVRFQQADDQGEVLRNVVSVLGRSDRTGQQTENRVLALAGLIGRSMAKGEIAAHQAAQIDAVKAQQARDNQAFYTIHNDASQPDDFHFHE